MGGRWSVFRNEFLAQVVGFYFTKHIDKIKEIAIFSFLLLPDVLKPASPRAILALSGVHRSKYREKVCAPGRQENPVRGSANLLVPPLISFAVPLSGSRAAA